MSKRGVLDDKKLDKSAKSLLNKARQKAPNVILGLGPNAAVGASGTGGSETFEPEVKFNFTPSSKVLKKGNAYIVFGKDRPSGKMSGKGARGTTGANAIDIVVGRLSSAKKPDGAIAENSFSGDAARIYLSQMTNVDLNFGLAAGLSGMQENRSAVAIKGDGVRLIGREGVKIVTGRSNNALGFGAKGEPNSHGEKVTEPAPLIELIAGNNTERRTMVGGLFNPNEVYDNLQGVAMGQNTTEAMREFSRMVSDLTSALFNFVRIQQNFNKGLAAAVGAGPVAGGAAIGSMAVSADIASFAQVWGPYYASRISKMLWDFHYLNPGGYRYIESRNVKTT